MTIRKLFGAKMPAGERTIQVPREMHRVAAIECTREAGETDNLVREFSISSEAPYKRWFGVEVLGHDASEVDLGPIAAAGSILRNHNADQPVAVVEKVWLDRAARKVRVRARFVQDNADSMQALKDIESGLIRGVSVGYSVNEMTLVKESDDGADEYRVTKWTVREASLTPVPADPSVGLGRSASASDNLVSIRVAGLARNPTAGETAMKRYKLSDGRTLTLSEIRSLKDDNEECATILAGIETLRAAGMDFPEDEPAPVATPTPVQTPAARAAGPEVVDVPKLLREQRESQIKLLYEIGREAGVCEKGDLAAWRVGTETAEEVRVEVRKRIDEKRKAPAGAIKPEDGPILRGNEGITRDERDTFRRGVEEMLLERGNVIKSGMTLEGKRASADEIDLRGQFRGRSLQDIARQCLVLSGRFSAGRVNKMSAMEVFSAAFVRGGERMVFEHGRAATHSTSDFPYILANTANKSLQKGYTEAPTTYQKWVRIESRSDFKTASIVALSGGADFLRVNENGEISQGRLSEKQEQYGIVTWGRGTSITRQALINDDIGALTRIPQLQGGAARRKLNMLVYARLLGGAGVGETLGEDAKAIFHADHNNYTSTGTAISVASLGVGQSKLGLQRGKADTEAGTGELLNHVGRFLLTGRTLGPTARQVVGSTVDVSKSNDAMNPFKNAYDVIEEALLEAAWTHDGTAYTGSATRWYLATDPNVCDTIVLGLLDGIDAPSMIEAENEGGVLGMQLWSWIDAEAKAADFRGLYLNLGA